ncbi:homoserine dehydrogenase [bacterium]|nr:homoserine dehydrogenase [bacterium]
MTKTVKCALIGLGNVGRSFLQILEEKEQRLAEQYGLHFQVVLVADSSGVAVCESGFDPAKLRHHKFDGGKVAGLPEFLAERMPHEALEGLTCELVLEASPVNLKDGEPGLSVVRMALQQGIHVVLANKGPLVLAFQELQKLAVDKGVKLSYSATVCGALPVINIGRRDLIAADIAKVRGVFNSTSNYILEEMSNGRSYAEALTEAQVRGIAEADPSLDVEGWDTANKLVIIANSFLGIKATLNDVDVSGITGINQGDLADAIAQGRRIKLVAQADRTETGYALSVAPHLLPIDDFLAGCSSWEMGIEIHSDLYEIMYHKIWEAEPLPTAAAMLRDAVNIWFSS